MAHLKLGALARRVVVDSSGSSAAEYALLIAFIAAVIVGSVTLLGTTLAGIFTGFTPSL